jgi:protein-L-isoaspartate(D-aspartate) O-methyltransferase
VTAAEARVPRHGRDAADLRRHAYDNRPLPIGQGQTISQPYIVALMTDLLECGRDAKVLEVGTGSGYQAAVLAEVVGHVYTIEIVPELGEGARGTLERLGYGNVTVRVGDGYLGWPEHAPFDGIIVTAAPSEVPPPLIEQLRPGGRIVIPVGEPWSGQNLIVLEKQPDGSIRRRNVLPVAFVPLTGPHAGRP